MMKNAAAMEKPDRVRYRAARNASTRAIVPGVTRRQEMLPTPKPS
jgi:hypothetical protein